MTVRMPFEDRIAIEDLMTAYCYAVDDLTDIEPLLALFSDDAVVDFSDIGLPAMHGKPAFRAFYEGVFADMSHHAHFISNFRPEAYDGETAEMTAYVDGFGRSHAGNEVNVQVRYRMKVRRQGDGWVCTRYAILAQMPMPGSLGEIHGNR